MPKVKLRNQEGNRSTGANRGRPLGADPYDRAPSTNALHDRSVPHGTPRRECPACGLDVGVKANGELRSHRVGPTNKRAWPCPGEHAASRARIPEQLVACSYKARFITVVIPNSAGITLNYKPALRGAQTEEGASLSQ